MGQAEKEIDRFWMCIIGPIDKNQMAPGSDLPMRCAVQKTFEKLIGREAEHCWAGWGLTQERMKEVQKVWNRTEEAKDDNECSGNQSG